MQIQLKYIQMVIILVILISYLSFVSYYKQKVVSLENKITQLESKNSQYKDSLVYVSERELQGEKLYNYDEWKKNEAIANDFVLRSEGKFKKDWGLFLVDLSYHYNVDPYIVYELLRVETGEKFDPELVGPETKYGHAYGLSQFMKNTAPWIADMAGLKYEEDLLFDPYYSIQLSVVYLDFLHNRYNGNWNQALTAYHRGIYGMEKYLQENGHAKSWYAKKIIGNAEENRLIAYAE